MYIISIEYDFLYLYEVITHELMSATNIGLQCTVTVGLRNVSKIMK